MDNDTKTTKPNMTPSFLEGLAGLAAYDNARFLNTEKDKNFSVVKKENESTTEQKKEAQE